MPSAPPRSAPSYDLVIATRNRPQALAVSIPLMLAQTPPPQRLIVIDASDDHEAAAAAVAEALAGAADIPGVGGIAVHLQHTAPGSARQRNLGLRLAQAEIVIFPDDDSLFYPDTAAQILVVYAADSEHRIAAVCAAPADLPPAAARLGAGAYAAATPSAIARAFGRLRQGVIDRTGFANPFVHVGTRLNGVHRVPDWLAAMDAVPVPYMTGFRMSFRRAVLERSGGFDEALIRYAWFEDIDASFGVMAHGLVVGARRARINHHRFAGARAGGHALGLWSVLNRAYIVMKHVHANAGLFASTRREAWRLRLYLLGRLGADLIGARSAHGRARLAGALAGHRRLSTLLAAPPGDLAACYRILRGEDAGLPDAGPASGGGEGGASSGGSAPAPVPGRGG